MSAITRTAAIAALLLASACSGEPEILEPDPSASSTGASAATPPPLPDSASEFSPSGAATYVQYWVDTFNFAAMTGDAAQLKDISAGCAPCTAYAEDFEALPEEQLAASPPWDIRSISASEQSDPILITAKVKVSGDKGSQTRELQFSLSEGDPFEINDVLELK